MTEATERRIQLEDNSDQEPPKMADKEQKETQLKESGGSMDLGLGLACIG